MWERRKGEGGLPAAVMRPSTLPPHTCIARCSTVVTCSHARTHAHRSCHAPEEGDHVLLVALAAPVLPPASEVKHGWVHVGLSAEWAE